MNKYYFLRPIRVFLLACLAICVFSQEGHAQCDFVEVAAEHQITHQFHDGLLGSGLSFVDFDGDGWDDLTFGTSKGETIEVYRNNQGHFEKISLQGVTNTCESKQITWIDFDNDGDKDLYYSCVGDNLVLYRNDGDLSFTDVTEELGLDSPLGAALGSNWADFDRDGWLDLYATYYGGQRNILYRNLEGTGFQNVTNQSNAAPNIKPTFCGIVFDYDNDGWEDIYLANDRSTRNELIRNMGDLSFEDVSEGSGANLPMDAMGTTLLDMNRDGYFEVYISNSPQGNALIFNNGNGTFTDIAQSSGTLFESVGWGVNTLDFDNDSYWDLYVSGSEIGTDVLSSALYQAIDESTFEQTQFPGMAADTMASFSNAIGDFNSDGRMDIAVNNANQTPSQLWQNSCTNDNHWLKVKLRGVASNLDGIGSRVVAYTEEAPLYQYMTAGTSFMAQNSDYLHFGLGQTTQVDSLLVIWPSGLQDVVINPGIDQLVEITEGSTNQPLSLSSNTGFSALCEGGIVTLSVEVYGQAEVTWSNGAVGRIISVEESGNYSASIQVGEGLLKTQEISISFEANPEVFIDTTPVTGTELGTITITEIDGPYRYHWSHDPKERSNQLTGLEAGIYQVLIISDAGCSITRTIEVEQTVVTSIDDPVLQSIRYEKDGNQLSIYLPLELSSKLQQYGIWSVTGKEVYQNCPQELPASFIKVILPKNLIDKPLLVDLQFTDKRLVKKLLFVD